MSLKTLKYLCTILSLLSLAACGALDFNQDKHVSSSLLNYLYPSGEHIQKSIQGEQKAQLPRIELPVRVGIAFVPSSGYSQISFTPAQQLKLLQKAKMQFSGYQFIEHIELIPANYLHNKGGFTNLQQVASLYNVDLMALVSYDQVQSSYAKDLSLLYLTVVGAHIFKGDDNHTQSFVDTAVFDVNTQSLLFRAPGTHSARKNSTLNDKALVQDVMSQKSFNIAMQDMLQNLDIELSSFIKRVKNEKVAELTYKSSYSGGGTSSLFLLIFLLLVLSFKFTHLNKANYKKIQ